MTRAEDVTIFWLLQQTPPQTDLEHAGNVKEKEKRKEKTKERKKVRIHESTVGRQIPPTGRACDSNVNDDKSRGVIWKLKTRKETPRLGMKKTIC